jgi:hypothetical protein
VFFSMQDCFYQVFIFRSLLQIKLYRNHQSALALTEWQDAAWAAAVPVRVVRGRSTAGESAAFVGERESDQVLNLQEVSSTYLAGYSPQHFISGAVVFPEPLPPVPGLRVVVVAGASVVIEGHSEAKSDWGYKNRNL